MKKATKAKFEKLVKRKQKERNKREKHTLIIEIAIPLPKKLTDEQREAVVERTEKLTKKFLKEVID